jgi:two-component system NtrC family response regulator
LSEKRILIIDDEVDVGNFFKRLLLKKGYQVVTATSEKEALTALSDWDFNVAMVDLKLPDTDGLTLLQLIKRAQPSCAVIIMTGFSTIKTAVEAMHLGAFEYIEKSFDDIDEIEALINNAANHAHKRQNRQIGEEDFWQHYAQEEHLQNMNASELNQLLLSLRGLENSVITIMRNKGLKPSQNRILKESEADNIKKALEENLWNVTSTAKALGIARNTLHRKIKLYGLNNS